jgi:kynureninase
MNSHLQSALKIAAATDQADPLGRWRASFLLPADTIYLNGNSLGPLPAGVMPRLEQVVREEWGEGLIRSWNDAGWWMRSVTLGDRLAPLIGAAAGEVAICDSTSVNLFKTIVAAMRLRPDRRVLVSHADNFPTDLYIAQGVRDLIPGMSIRLWDGRAPIESVLGPDVAALLLTHVDYRTAEMLDGAAITKAAHASGAIMVWDLAHSAGAVPVDLNGWGADLAVGCSYKYLNAGPGGPSFVFVATRHMPALDQPLTGWHGHAAPFAFTGDYAPDPTIRRMLCGSPPLLSFAPLEVSLELWAQVDHAALFAKSRALSNLFIELVAEACPELQLASPADARARGSHVALRFDEGYRLMRALIEARVIGDFRAPDLMRFGFSPFYNSHTDVVRAVATLAGLVRRKAWLEIAAARSLVT